MDITNTHNVVDSGTLSLAGATGVHVAVVGG